MKRGFGMPRDEVFDFLTKSEKTAYEFCVKELKNVFAQSASTNLLSRFKTYFKKDEDGKLREWSAIEEGKIREYFEESKTRIDTLLE